MTMLIINSGPTGTGGGGGGLSVALSAVTPGTPQEIGADVVSPTFNLVPSGVTGPIITRTIGDNDGNPVQNFLGIPDPLTMPFTYTRTAIGGTVIFTGTMDDGSGPAVDALTYTWLPRAFYGVSANPALTTEAGIEALPQSSLESGQPIVFTVSPANEYIYYSWPAVYGAFSALDFQIGPFPGGFIDLGTVSLTANTPGAPVNTYNIARSTNLLTGSGLVVTVT